MKIQLTRGKIALIDDIDSDLANNRWYASITKGSTLAYAIRREASRNIRMHRVILERVLGRPLRFNEDVDHINHDGLDNRRVNLRVATRSENNLNQRTQTRNKTSKFKGVSWDAINRKWKAQIKISGKTRHIGSFASEKNAAIAYDEVLSEHSPDFGCLNFPLASCLNCSDYIIGRRCVWQDIAFPEINYCDHWTKAT